MASRQRADQQAISGTGGGLQPESADASVVRHRQTAGAAGVGRGGGLLRGEAGRYESLDDVDRGQDRPRNEMVVGGPGGGDGPPTYRRPGFLNGLLAMVASFASGLPKLPANGLARRMARGLWP